MNQKMTAGVMESTQGARWPSMKRVAHGMASRMGEPVRLMESDVAKLDSETRRIAATGRIQSGTPEDAESLTIPTHSAQNIRSAEKGIFRREGEYWTIAYGGSVVRLKNTKGLVYLARLLGAPGMAFHVLDLAGGTARRSEVGVDAKKRPVAVVPQREEELERAGIHIGSLGDAGVLLDDQAKAAYRRRRAELREEVEEAKARGDFVRAEKAEEEGDALTAELARAVGLGGRDRRAASATERARQSVTRAIKAVVDRIAKQEPTLSGLVARCLKTGTFCSYTPDPTFPVAWEIGVPPSDVAVSSLDQAASPDRAGQERSERGSTAAGELLVSQLPSVNRTTFVGREVECHQLHLLVDRALNGCGSVALLSGGAGIGKTRLAMEIAEYAMRQGFRVLLGHCYEREEPYPYLPFVEMLETALAQAPSLEKFRRALGDNAAELAQLAPRLRRVFPDIPAPLELPPRQVRRSLFQSLAGALARAAHRVPQFLVLDDLQWADESTLALLHYLAHRIAQIPVVIIGTYRDTDLETSPALVRTLEELIRIGVRPLKLQGLSQEAVAQMLSGLSRREPPAHLVRVIFEETQGNPFFVEEVYKHLVEEGKIFDAAGRFRSDLTISEIDVPDNVRLVLGRRLERLSEKGKHVLAAAAVIGRSVNFQLLVALLDQMNGEDLLTAIEEAQRMGLMVSSAEKPEAAFVFAHELVRQTLLASFALPRRQRLHLTVAEAIERVYAGSVNEHAAEVAHHLVQAGSLADAQKVVHYLALAGRGALEAAAYDEALRSFESALPYQNAIDVRERAEVLSHLARAERGKMGRSLEPLAGGARYPSI